MKVTHMRTWIIPLMMMAVVACQEKSKTTGSSSNSSSYTLTTGTSNGGTTTGTTTGGTTGTATGSTAGGTTGGGDTSLEAWKFNVVMSGKNPTNPAYSARWYPGMYPSNYNSTSYPLGDFLQLYSSNTFIFKSDTKFHLRVKVLAEPNVSGSATNGAQCYQRQDTQGRICGTPGSTCSNDSSTYPYNKLRFDVAIRDIIYTNGSYSLSDSYAGQYSGDNGVSVGGYSNVFSWDKGGFPGRNPATGNDDATGGATLVNGIVGHVVEIKNVASNAYCAQANYSPTSPYCPFASHPSTRCWRVEMQLSTDKTGNAGF